MNPNILSTDLLDFLLYDWLGADAEARETHRSIFDVAARLASDHFITHHRLSDLNEPRLVDGQVAIVREARDALALMRELGLFGASFPEALGGLELPHLVTLALGGIFSSANVSTYAFPMLTAANARLLTAFGSAAQVDAFAAPQIEGRWFGTMCMSEPQAGSGLADIRTRARLEGSDELGDRYRVIGNKMWISGGDQDASENIVHLVLAKAEDADGNVRPGTRGLSLFVVPKVLPDGAPNDVSVAGLNHKMGFRGTPNCLLNFGERDGAVGWRIGGEGHGIAQMFMMMNEARVGVGMCGAAVAYRGYRHAVAYAAERVQGRPIGVVDGPPVPILRHADVRRMLLQAKAYAEGALAICLYCAHLLDQGDEHEPLLALLTPIAKNWPAEFGLIANDLAIQVHGGYGYTRDFDVEMLWRDNRLNPIHEGTTGIQGLDLLGRKLLRSDGTALATLIERISATVAAAAAVEDLTDHGTALSAHWSRITEVVEGLRAAPSDEAVEDATRFLRAFGHGVVAWLWLDQAVCAARVPRRTEAVAAACRYFFEAELPMAAAWLEGVAAQSDLIRTIPDGVFD